MYDKNTETSMNIGMKYTYLQIDRFAVHEDISNDLNSP